MSSNSDSNESSFYGGWLFPSIIMALFIYLFFKPFEATVLTIPYFWYKFTVGITALGYFITVGFNFATQSMNCNDTNSSSAFRGALYTIPIMFIIGCAVSGIDFLRLPVASAFVSFFVKDPMDVGLGTPNPKKKVVPHHGACCTPKYKLGEVETQYPKLKLMSYGFYMAFAMAFSTVIGMNMSSICGS